MGRAKVAKKEKGEKTARAIKIAEKSAQEGNGKILAQSFVREKSGKEGKAKREEREKARKQATAQVQEREKAAIETTAATEAFSVEGQADAWQIFRQNCQ